MSKWLHIIALALGLSLLVPAQSGQPSERPSHGTNYDPPPMPKPEAKAAPPPPEKPEQPLFNIPPIDWGSRDTWVKLALLAGAVVLARRVFHDMSN